MKPAAIWWRVFTDEQKEISPDTNIRLWDLAYLKGFTGFLEFRYDGVGTRLG